GQHGIRKYLPALVAMRVGLMGADGEHGVEQQDTLVRPGNEAAARRRGDVHVDHELLEDVDERRWRPYTRRHRKRQSMGLALVVVRILSQDDDADRNKRGVLQSIKNEIVGRINLVR